MKVCAAAVALLCFSPVAGAQSKSAPPAQQQAVTVPATIDHNRMIIDVDVPLAKGGTERVRAWVDNGNPDLSMSMRLALLADSDIECSRACFGGSPAAIFVGGMAIPLNGMRAQIPLMPDNARSVMVPGLPAEITIPSTVLRHYDVLIDFPGRKFTIGTPGTIHFRGSSGKVQINAENGLIQVPSQIEKGKYNLVLDLGSSISFLSGEVFDKLAAEHPDWPNMTGGVGSANVSGQDEETKWKVMRLDRVQYGPLFLTNVPNVDAGKMDSFEKHAGTPTVGLLGSQVFLNYRVGLDYAHSTVYFDIGRMFNFPDFDVVGLILRAEDDGKFTILGVADFDGKPSVPEGPEGVQAGDHLVAVDDVAVHGVTMGQVWAMLGGTPGLERKLTIERGGRQFSIMAQVQHFLGELPDEKDSKKKK
jgi:hypothetical protein